MTIFTALITPFKEDLSLDEEGLTYLIKKQEEADIDGLVILGTTAETPTLTREEKEKILTLASTSSLPLIVGCGTNCTRTTLETIQWAVSFGAKAALVVNPYYNRPPQAGLLTHFLSLANRSPCPLYLYNHPGRTGVELTLQTLEELALHPNIIGVKEVTQNFIDTTLTLKTKKPEFHIYAGDDQLAHTAMCNGADGVISVASNLIPKQMKKLVTASFPEARELQQQLWPLFKALTCSTNPIPIKAAMQLAQLPAGHPRLPLIPLDIMQCQLFKDLLP